VNIGYPLRKVMVSTLRN